MRIFILAAFMANLALFPQSAVTRASLQVRLGSPCSSHDSGRPVKDPDGAGTLCLDRTAFLTERDVESAQIHRNSAGHPVILLTFRHEAAMRELQVTMKNIGNRVGILLNGRLLSARAFRRLRACFLWMATSRRHRPKAWWKPSTARPVNISEVCIRTAAPGARMLDYACMAHTNFVVLIPAYKPGPDFPGLVADLVRLGVERIFVVDDGSGVWFRARFDEAGAHPQVRMVRHAINLGKGAALKSGINAILCEFPDVGVVVTADADGQHAPEDIIAVAQTACANPGALVLGSRVFAESVPFRSKLGNNATKIVLRIVAGQKAFRYPNRVARHSRAPVARAVEDTLARLRVRTRHAAAQPQ